jgi:hypothetical protein
LPIAQEEKRETTLTPLKRRAYENSRNYAHLQRGGKP